MADRDTEYQQVAALLVMDIANFAHAFPENEALQRLSAMKDRVISDANWRQERYEAAIAVASLLGAGKVKR